MEKPVGLETKCRAKVDDGSGKIREADATVLLERRRLFEWVLEPLYSLSGRS